MARRGKIVRFSAILANMFWNVLLAIGLILLASAAYAGLQGAPWVPTWKKDLKRIERLVALQPGEKFVELGCGNGRVCRAMKKSQPNATIEGVELSLLQHGVGWLQSRLAGSNVRHKFGNVFAHDLSSYDAVYLFLMPKTYEKIRPKLEAELKPGARVLTYVWPIPGWEEDVLDMAEGSPNLFLYKR
ncbi:MAG: class I SAM-dependent methyltransferase [Patescibacteria group bacterium]